MGSGLSRSSAQIRNRWSRASIPSASLRAVQETASSVTFCIQLKESLRGALIAHACADDDVMEITTNFDVILTVHRR